MFPAKSGACSSATYVRDLGPDQSNIDVSAVDTRRVEIVLAKSTQNHRSRPKGFAQKVGVSDRLPLRGSLPLCNAYRRKPSVVMVCGECAGIEVCFRAGPQDHGYFGQHCFARGRLAVPSMKQGHFKCKESAE